MKVQGSVKLAKSSPAYPFKSIRHICKHYGKPRIRSEGKRPVQQYVATGCSAVLRLNLDSNGEKYKVTKLILDHNHPISAHTLPMYSKNRTLTADEIHEIKPFIETNVETKNIRQYVSSNIGKSVINKDINNVKQKVKTGKTNGRSQGRMLTDVLNELTQKDSMAIVNLEVDEKSNLDLLPVYKQTSKMQEMFQNFPTIIFMDNTYNVNIEGYILNAILVEDENGNGKPVAYSYMRRESKETLRRIIEIFEYNDISKIQVVILDKDLTEIAVLKEKLPNTHIQICTFHVIKYFKSNVAKLKENSDVKAGLVQLLRSILYSQTEDTCIYNERRERLQQEFSFFGQSIF